MGETKLMTTQATKIDVNLENIPVKQAIDMEAPFNEYYNELIVMMQEVKDFIEVDKWLPVGTDDELYRIAVIDVYGMTYYVNRVNGELNFQEIETTAFEEVVKHFNVIYQ